MRGKKLRRRLVEDVRALSKVLADENLTSSEFEALMVAVKSTGLKVILTNSIDANANPDEQPYTSFKWDPDSGALLLVVSCDVVRDLMFPIRVPRYRPGTGKTFNWSTVHVTLASGQILETRWPDLVLERPFNVFATYFEKSRPLLIPQNELSELDELMAKVSRIRIPRPDPAAWVVQHEYLTTGTYLGFKIENRGSTKLGHRGLSFMDDKIDLRIPYIVYCLNYFEQPVRAVDMDQINDALIASLQSAFAEHCPSIATAAGSTAFIEDDHNFVWEPQPRPG